MTALPRLARGALALTFAVGFSMAPVVAAASVAPPADVCEPGVYALYSNGELVGVLVVRSDCSTQVYWAEE